jgi:hypothetical protein
VQNLGYVNNLMPSQNIQTVQNLGSVNNLMPSQNIQTMNNLNNLMPSQSIQTMNNMMPSQNIIQITTVNNLMPSKNLQSVSGDAAQAAGGYQIGAAVDIYSKSAGSWFEGKVARIEGTDVTVDFQSSDGKWKSKCMPVGHEDLRLRGATQPQAAGIVQDQMVEYYSSTLAKWIEAQVIKVEPGGYQLDVKPGVTITADKIRLKNSLAPSSTSTPGGAAVLGQTPLFTVLEAIPDTAALNAAPVLAFYSDAVGGQNGFKSCTTFARLD